ncbi:MAG: hypothetical protein K2O67_03455 [Clostridia bacterium]|nr:hypothetical protein [Clostridia bacterium]
MLCQNCKKREATVNHKEIINGKICAQHLCDFCASELFGGFEEEFKNAFVNGLFGSYESEAKICPGCGLSFDDYVRTGLLGCPSCYDVFKEELIPRIGKIQGKTTHVGKSGGVNTAEHDAMIKLSALQQAMERALSCGDYAAAGRINEQMNAIKKRTGGRR